MGAGQGRPEVLHAQIEQSQRACEVVPIAAVQNRFNVEDRKHDEVVGHCAEHGIAFVPFYPLRGPGTSAEKLRCLLDRAPNVLPIPGTRSIDHLRENLAALGA